MQDDPETVIVRTPDAEAARLAELYLTPSEYGPRDRRAREWARRRRAALKLPETGPVPEEMRGRLAAHARLSLAAVSGKYVGQRFLQILGKSMDGPLLTLMDAHLRAKRVWGIESDAEEDAKEAARMWEGTFRLWQTALAALRRGDGAKAAGGAGAAVVAPAVFGLVPPPVAKRMGALALRLVRFRPLAFGVVGVAVLAAVLAPFFIEAWTFGNAYSEGPGDASNGST